MPWPRLWSPEQPHLYRLVVTLRGSSSDTWEERVGFRHIEIRGQDFYLNGKRLVLRGVCRHEFTSASGYGPSPAETRHELALIRHAGFNFVRLVHHPQAPWLPRLAAELGLLVSEEPGACWHDLSDETIAAAAIESMQRTVQRDRNVPSIIAWLIYNECQPNNAYAVRIAQAIRALAPTSLISMAACSDKAEEVKAMAAAANLSFYGINLYSPWPNDYVKSMDIYADRPLVFTEWGACPGNARTLKGLCDNWAIHSRADEPQRFAGCCYWVWADYEERSRPRPAAEDGWTTEGLLDQRGEPRPDLQILSLMNFAIANPPPVRQPRVEVLAPAPQRPEGWQPISLPRDLPGQREAAAILAAWRSERLRYEAWFLPMAPRAPYTRPALACAIDPAYEILRIDLWEKRFSQPGHLRKIRWRLCDPDALLGLWAISVATA